MPQTLIEPRDRVMAGLTPKPELICVEEYQAVAQHILQHRGAVLMDELHKEVARILGFARSGPKVQNAVEIALSQLLERGQLSHVASGVQWNSAIIVMNK